jgi:hypothetical protein
VMLICVSQSAHTGYNRILTNYGTSPPGDVIWV